MMSLGPAIAITGLKIYPYALLILELANHYFGFCFILDNIMVTILIVLFLILILYDTSIIGWLGITTIILLILCVCYFVMFGNIRSFSDIFYTVIV